MSRSLARGFLRGTLALALATFTVALGGTAAQAANPRLALTALSFAQSTVDASTPITAVNRLTFTVTNSDPDAETVRGVVTLRTRSTVTGELVGHDRSASFAFGSTWEDADYVSGTPQESSYAYDFRVPRYSDAATTTWEVTKVTIVAGEQEATAGAAKVQAFPGYRFTAQTLVDASGPTVDQIRLHNSRGPFVYVGAHPATYAYEFSIQDNGTGFWKGTLKVAGPGGQSVTTPFTWEYDRYTSGGLKCGGFSGGGQEANYVTCDVQVTLPAGANPGNWRVAQLVLFNNGGVRTTYQNPTSPSVTVTSNSTVQVSDFAVTPNLVNNWQADALTELSMAVTGAERGVASLSVGFEMGCEQASPPTTKADGRIAIQVRVARGVEECDLTHVIVVDGTAKAALYGSTFSAPDPQITITRVPSTEPPSALSAALNPTTATVSELSNQPLVELTVDAALKVAPARIYTTYLYDADGNVAYQSWGSDDQAADGTIVDRLYLGWYGLPAGEYAVGFTLTDAADASTSYGVLGDPASEPVPGGPLVFTITEG